MHVACPLLADRSFPGIRVAARRLVVVTHEQPRFGRQRQNALDRPIERAGVAAGKVGARSAVVRHEHRVADEYRVTYPVRYAGRRMTGRVDDLAVERADLEALAVLEQMIELGTIARHVDCIEDRPEDALHVADMFADRHLGAGLQLDIGRARHMIGMRMRLQHLRNLDAKLAGLRENGIGRGHRRLAAAEVVVEHGIDHRAFHARRIPHQIADGIGRLVEKRLYLRVGGAGHDFLRGGTVV